MAKIGKRLRASARNALEIARFGQLGDAYHAPFDVVDQGPHHRLRRYSTQDGPVALLIPPLMLTAEIYDVAPDVSVVSTLAALGLSPWVVDFGAPEHEAGGMTRTFDDHIRAVARAVERTCELTGRSVHLCGYSQGGMFAYQTAAYLRGKGIRSIVTFGSPVDLHKNVPAIRSDLTGSFMRAVFPITNAVLSRIEGLPGKVTSAAFKLASTRKELEQRIEFIRSLHDRERTMKREARRRFLGGGGFVAWPGPAFRSFVEEFVVHNRMVSGGFVIDGRTVSLSDLKCPILAFIGATDEIARPATILPLTDAAPHADIRFKTLPAGHFGIVVGSHAIGTTWPAVATWIEAIERGATAKAALPSEEEPQLDELDPGDLDVEIDLFFDVVARSAKDVWRRLGSSLASANDTADAVRWQEPRLRRLARMEPDTRISASRELKHRARETPEATFFIWQGRAFSYNDADTRVTNVARGLYSCGVRRGDRIGVVMSSRPSLLTAVTALGRLGAIAVIAPPDASPAHAFARLEVRRAMVDPEHASRDLGCELLILGGGPRTKRDLEGAIDMEAIDPDTVPLPRDVAVDPGRARDIASILLRPSERDDGLRAVPVTNHRWALSAIGAAAACLIKPGDTVGCAVPLHHPTGLLVSAGAALVGGARLALFEAEAGPIDAAKFLSEVRRAGATVVFYAGEMLRPLLEQPVNRGDTHLPVRVFAGSGMRPELAARLRERFEVDTLEFYAGTAHRAILADATGDAPGSLGDILPGSAEVRLVKRAPNGQLSVAPAGEPALLAVRVADDELETLGDVRGLVPNAFGDGASWLVTNDVIRRDDAGRHWFVDSLAGFVGDVSLRKVEDALYALPEVRLASAWQEKGAIVAAFSSSEPIPLARLDAALTTLPPASRPTIVTRLVEIPVTDGFRPRKDLLPSLVEKAKERWSLREGRYVG